MAQLSQGGCLSGSVRYRVAGELRPVIVCRYRHCRGISGHFVAAKAAPVRRIRIDSGGSRRFGQREGADVMSIIPTLDGDTGLPAISRIYTADRGDYTYDPAVPCFVQAAKHPRAYDETDRG